MTTHFIRRSGGINYIRYVGGIPYLYTDTSGVIPSFTVCQTGTITSDYAITFIDEAHPLYVIGSGEIGAMWGPDIYYYNEHIDPNFPSCAHILFDVDTPFVARGSYQGQPITEDPFYVYPTGVDTNSPVGCELPMPELNVVQIARPSGGIESDGSPNAIGTISQTEFKDNIITGIETVWGTGFWDRMSSSSNKLWIIRENGLSLGSGVIQSGVDLFKNYLTAQNIDYTEHFPSCGDTDRYLGWLTDCITYDGENVSCTGIFTPPDITQNNIQASGDNSDPNGTNKLVLMSIEGYSSDDGDLTPTYYVEIDESVNNITNWFSTSWPIPNGEGYYSLGLYREYGSVEDASPLTYQAAISIYYENNLQKALVTADCYSPPLAGATTYYWKCIIPLDKYGIPNGVLQPDELYLINIANSGNTCVPRFPEIVFTAYTPTSFALPSGTDCTQYNKNINRGSAAISKGFTGDGTYSDPITFNGRVLIDIYPEPGSISFTALKNGTLRFTADLVESNGISEDTFGLYFGPGPGYFEGYDKYEPSTNESHVNKTFTRPIASGETIRFVASERVGPPDAALTNPRMWIES